MAKKLTIVAAAAKIGVNRRTMAEYVKAGCPLTSVAAIKKWRAENIKPRTISETRQAKLEADLARTNEQVAALVRQREIEEGRYLERDDVETCVAEMIIHCRTLFEGTGERLRMCFPRELQQQLVEEVDREIRLVLKRLSEWEWRPKNA